MIRDYMATLGKWKSKELDKFISDFEPDLIFGNLHYIPVVNQLMIYVKQKFNIPLVLYPWDDFYSMKRISYSPFFWLRFLSERPLIKKCAKNCDLMYTIIKQMQQEYFTYFGKNSQLLYKGHVFKGEAPVKERFNKPLKFIYMGNIGAGRWKVLGDLANVISAYNKDEKKAELHVYTLSPHTKAICTALNIKGSSKLMEPIPTEETMKVMNSADVLVHVEPTNKADMYFYRLSFSTKLVDYFYNAKCVLAIGGETSAMDYLRENDAAIVESNPNNFYTIVGKILNNPDIINEYSHKAWECGKRNHQIDDIQKRIYEDFSRLVKSRKK